MEEYIEFQLHSAINHRQKWVKNGFNALEFNKWLISINHIDFTNRLKNK